MNDLPFELVFWGSVACSVLGVVVLIGGIALALRCFAGHSGDDDNDQA